MKGKSKRMVCLALALTLVLAFAGCGDSGGSGEAAAAGGGKDPYVDEIKIAYMPMTLSSVNGAEWGRAVENELSMYPNISVNTFDGKGSAETQNQIISELIVQKYDALVMQAADSSALAASITRAEENGIKVITMNIPVDTAHSAHVSAANIETGQLVARAIGEALNGEGEVGLIDVPTNMTAMVKMGQGYREVLAEEFPNIQLVADQAGDWSAEMGNSITRDFISKHPNIKAIFTTGDAAAIGAMQAVEAAGKTGDIMIWGSDGEKAALELIGEGGITGTVYTNFHDMGSTAARLALYLIATGVDGSTLAATPSVMVAPLVVTKDNVDTIPESQRW